MAARKAVKVNELNSRAKRFAIETVKMLSERTTKKIRANLLLLKTIRKERAQCLERIEKFQNNHPEKKTEVKSLKKLVKLADKLPLVSRLYFLRLLSHYIYIYLPSEGNFKKTVSIFESYYRLFTPEKRFEIKWKSKHVFPDGYTMLDVLAFRVRGIGEVAVLKISFPWQNARVTVKYIQGIKGVDMREVSKRLGKQWYEAVMDKIIKSFIPPIEAGVEIKFDVRHDKILWKKIRDRYLIRTRHSSTWETVGLNPRRKRVRKLLGPLAKNLAKEVK
jgi:hypothetical protein